MYSRSLYLFTQKHIVDHVVHQTTIGHTTFNGTPNERNNEIPSSRHMESTSIHSVIWSRQPSYGGLWVEVGLWRRENETVRREGVHFLISLFLHYTLLGLDRIHHHQLVRIRTFFSTYEVTFRYQSRHTIFFSFQIRFRPFWKLLCPSLHLPFQFFT